VSFVRLLVAVDVCLITACLVVISILVLLRRRDQGGGREQHHQHRRHRRDGTGAHRVGESVAEIREREGADRLRYYPRGQV